MHRLVQRSIAGPARSSPRAVSAFTLVELLVVIGIIALLISIILPSLSAARRAAQRVVCSTRIKEQLDLAATFCAAHRGYYPLVGVIPGVLPYALQDNDGVKYMYTDDLNSNSNGDGGGGGGASNLPEELSPITIALSFQASKSSPLVVTRADATNSALYGDEKGFIRQFYCPTQATSTAEILSKVPYMDLFYSYPVPGGVEQGNGYWDRWRISYIYNEGALGWGPDDGVNYQRARGKATNIRQTSKTFFACDGLPAIPNNPARADLNSAQMTGEGFATLYNNIINPNNGRAVKAPVTMADALAGNGNAGDPQCFDLIRHQGKINIGFFDGHVETRTINSKDLSSVYLIAP